VAPQSNPLKISIKFIRMQMREHDSAHRSTVCRQTTSDGQIYGHDARHMRARHVKQFVVHEGCHGTRFMQNSAKSLEDWLRGLRQSAGGGVGMAQRKNPVREGKLVQLFDIHKA
jgi:hypothetical protein